MAGRCGMWGWGNSSDELARDVGVAMKCSHRMRHRWFFNSELLLPWPLILLLFPKKNVNIHSHTPIAATDAPSNRKWAQIYSLLNGGKNEMKRQWMKQEEKNGTLNVRRYCFYISHEYTRIYALDCVSLFVFRIWLCAKAEPKGGGTEYWICPRGHFLIRLK